MKTIKPQTDNNTVRDWDDFETYLSCIQDHFNSLMGEDGIPLFTTDAENLYDVFLSGLPEDAKQEYNCSTCRRFFDHYAGLVAIDEDGSKFPAVFPADVPVFYKEAIKQVRRAVSRAKITGVFFSDTANLGILETGPWKHLAVCIPHRMVHANRLETTQQASAAKSEEHRLLCEAMNYYSKDTIQKAVNLLRSNDLYRSEKVLGCAEWLLRVRLEIDATNPQYRSNLLWRYAATAPVGYCHVRSGMIGTLLDDIADRMPLSAVMTRFADKMNPTKYQRPTAAPSAANVRKAEEIFEKLGLAKSLERRFARNEEISEKVWIPSESATKPRRNGLFASVITKDDHTPFTSETMLPQTTMTWEKFQRTVLPSALKIEYYVENKHQNFAALLTAVDETAPPIIQWDSEEQRNPYSWYMYNGGSMPSRWGLKTGYCEVTGITLQPNMWYSGFEHQGKGVIFLLKGARDNDHRGIALFPEILKSNLHAVRSTIEAYSQKAELAGYDEASACGLILQNGNTWNARFRVTSEVGTTIYTLDRWD